MSASNPRTALLVVDVQESFRHRPYWSADEASGFLARTERLIAGARRRGLPVAQIFHVEDEGVFALASGHVRTLAPLEFTGDAVFYKKSHSALVGSGLEVWLTRQGIQRVIVCGIRTEQCCETTTRHASDVGFEVDYVTEATLTFAMTDRHGRTWTPAEIRERTELVLADRFARIVTVDEALERAGAEPRAA
jgi:nicotinamidase-related amidase